MKGTSWYDVLLDGNTHGCYIEDNDPPEAGQERQLGSVYARIDEVVTGTGGKRLIVASRHPTPRIT
jgi:hypothetical protein